MSIDWKKGPPPKGVGTWLVWTLSGDEYITGRIGDELVVFDARPGDEPAEGWESILTHHYKITPPEEESEGEGREPRRCEEALARVGVFKGAEGLRAFAEADEFWSRQPYETRFYFGGGAFDYLHRAVLRAAVRALDTPPEEESPAPFPREGAEGELVEDLCKALDELLEAYNTPIASYEDGEAHAGHVYACEDIAKSILARARGQGS